MSNQKCPICQNQSELRASSYSGYQYPDKFQIFQCLTCDASFSFPRTDATKVYDNIYRLGRKVPEYQRYWQYMDNIKNVDNPLEYLTEIEDTYWGVAEALKSIGTNGHSEKILEVGSGLGYLTYALRKNKYDITGIDVSAVAVSNASQNFGDYYIQGDVYKFSNEHESTYDSVILTEVIEHVEDPLGFLKSLFKLLKPNGKIILTTPNKSFFPRKAVWASTPPPIHCYWFSETSIRWFAEILGGTVRFVNFSAFYKHDIKINVTFPYYYATIGPILNENGDLISNSQKTTIKSNGMIGMLKKLPLLKKVYKLARRIVIGDEFRSCGERGLVLCAILEKK